MMFGHLPSQQVSIASLVPDPNNPNVMDPARYAELRRAIEQEGFLQPILVAPIAEAPGRFWLVDGHHRVRAAAEVGYIDVPAIAREMTGQQVTLLRMGMNRLRGELDLTKATDLLQGLVKAGVPLDALWLSGFSPSELDGLLRAPEVRQDDFPAVSPVLADEPVAAERPFALEVSFGSRQDLVAVKRALRRAGGASRDMAFGLLAVLGLDK